jgi:hypothetical protein
MPGPASHDGSCWFAAVSVTGTGALGGWRAAAGLQHEEDGQEGCALRRLVWVRRSKGPRQQLGCGGALAGPDEHPARAVSVAEAPGARVPGLLGGEASLIPGLGRADHAVYASNARICRIEYVAQVHAHALLGIFDRSSMAAMIVDSTCAISLSGQAERRLGTGGDRALRAVRRTQNGQICTKHGPCCRAQTAS